MQSDRLEDALIEGLTRHFREAVKDFVVRMSTDVPFLQLEVEMSLYNFFVVRLLVERNTMFFSILQSDVQLQLFKASLSEGKLEMALATLDREVRLRIPDKYLQAKGWQAER